MSILNHAIVSQKQWRLLCCFFVFITASSALHAITRIEITNASDWKKTIINELQILPDETHHYTLNQILFDTTIAFFSNKDEKPKGLNYWGKLKLVNHADQDEYITFASNFWDYVDLFFLSGLNRIDTLHIGILATNFKSNYLIQKDDDVTILANFRASGQFRRESNINLIISKSIDTLSKNRFYNYLDGIIVGIMLGLALYNLFLYFSLRDKAYLWYTIYSFSISLLVLSLFSSHPSHLTYYFFPDHPKIAFFIKKISDSVAWIAYLQFSRLFLKLKEHMPRMNRVFNSYTLILILLFIINWSGIYQFNGTSRIFPWNIAIALGLSTSIYMYYHGYFKGWYFILGQFFIFLGNLHSYMIYAKITILPSFYSGLIIDYIRTINFSFLLWDFELIFLSFALASKYNFLQKDMVRVELEKEQEKQALLASQNEILEKQVQERTGELSQSINTLQATQAQLIQSEKMASLGELTSGIAHEIQNPLNFITNFSELNLEMLEEMDTDLREDEDIQFIKNLKKNSGKIHLHSKRVDSIVKGMLQHSRKGNTTREIVDINSLCEESLKLAYHAYKAKDKAFCAVCETSFDASLPKIAVIPQDISRVLLNIINNAFYAVNEKSKSGGYASNGPSGKSRYDIGPLIKITTKANNHEISIFISNNGRGIPANNIDKIFQPFFTTKPTGEGTGLGLSLAYDIITKGHGGELKVKSKDETGTEFEIVLPMGLI